MFNIDLNKPIIIPAKWTNEEENEFLNELAEKLLGHKDGDDVMDVYEDLAYLKYVILYNKHKEQMAQGGEEKDFSFTLSRLFLWVSSMNHEDRKNFENMTSNSHVYVLNTLFRRYTSENMIRVRVDVLTRLYCNNDKYFVNGLETKWSHFVSADK